MLSTHPTTAAGRPRDQRIDDAVLAATATCSEVGYARCRSPRSRRPAPQAGDLPAVAVQGQLVHEAAFPTTARVPDTGDLRADLGDGPGAVELFARPVVRAAVPGLLAEFAADPDLHAPAAGRSRTRSGARCADRVAAATDRGELRPGVDPAVVLELVGGGALLALLTRPPDDLDERWVQSTVTS